MSAAVLTGKDTEIATVHVVRARVKRQPLLGAGVQAVGLQRSIAIVGVQGLAIGTAHYDAVDVDGWRHVAATGRVDGTLGTSAQQASQPANGAGRNAWALGQARKKAHGLQVEC